MDGQRYYIYENGAARSVSRPFWEDWTEENRSQLRVRETHIFKKGTPKVLSKILTYFTGVDTSPETDEPYLWRTCVFDCAVWEAWKHTSEKDARERHDGYVSWIASMLRKEGFDLAVIEIELSKTHRSLS